MSDRKTPLRLDAAGSSRDRRTLSDITLPSEPETTMQAKHLEAACAGGCGTLCLLWLWEWIRQFCRFVVRLSGPTYDRWQVGVTYRK